MNRETGAWIAVALLSVSALGVSATTLDSSTSTDANDVIELDYDTVPIGQDTASNLVDEIEGDEQNGDAANPAPADSGDPTQSQQTNPADSGSEADSRSDPDQQRDAGSQQERLRQSERASTMSEPPSLLDRLLALLTALLPSLLVVAGVVVAAAVAVRYRERLAALFAGPDPAADADQAGDETTTQSAPSPADPVEAAWLGMVRHLDLDDPGTKTTSECARAAMAAGLDPEAVETLTRTYEEVRYGGRPVTDQRAKRARQSERRLDDGGGA